MPTVGVEEEFLLVDPGSGAPVAKNADVAHAATRRGIELQRELTSCQVETTTKPMTGRTELRDELRRLRAGVAQAAGECGAQLLAVGLPPSTPHEFPITDTPRYHRIAEQYGMIAHEQGICGCHVHVEVAEPDIAVLVCNRLRPWLPGLLALVANSAIYRNADSGYASWRSMLWGRWPTAGPPPRLESIAEYRATLALLKAMGVLLDDGMVYWYARPSAKFPTVEIRIADVPATTAETVLLAVLARALVITSLGEIRSGAAEPAISEPVLRARYWLAARDGLHAPVLAELVDHIAPALHHTDELAYASAELDRIRRCGNGAERQRRAWARRGEVVDVLAEATAATLE